MLTGVAVVGVDVRTGEYHEAFPAPVSTTVRFRQFDETEIEDYVWSGEPLGGLGASRFRVAGRCWSRAFVVATAMWWDCRLAGDGGSQARIRDADLGYRQGVELEASKVAEEGSTMRHEPEVVVLGR